MTILQISGYKFIVLNDLQTLQDKLQQECLAHKLLGTILISHEGININICGNVAAIKKMQILLATIPQFSGLRFHETYTELAPFKQLKVKIKKEIVTFNCATIKPTQCRAPSISPAQLCEWLDNDVDFILLDTRNDFEFAYGTFKSAIHLNLKQFTEFQTLALNLARDKPIVMFCTGGIRCEKAALFLIENGFSKVYQLDGGILGYFAACGKKHFIGECFVFDNRVAVDANLKVSNQHSLSNDT